MLGNTYALQHPITDIQMAPARYNKAPSPLYTDLTALEASTDINN